MTCIFIICSFSVLCVFSLKYSCSLESNILPKAFRFQQEVWVLECCFLLFLTVWHRWKRRVLFSVPWNRQGWQWPCQGSPGSLYLVAQKVKWKIPDSALTVYCILKWKLQILCSKNLPCFWKLCYSKSGNVNSQGLKSSQDLFWL